MKPISVEEVLGAVGGSTINPIGNITGVSTDSRKINKGELFIPLVGENFDGHDFISEAFEKGAAAVLCEMSKRTKVLESADLTKDNCIIYVDNTAKALLLLAKYYRSLFDIPFIAVTGSVGKTTTKNFIAEVLSAKFNVLKTEGNLNNEIGLPLTIFRLEPEHEIGVVELGMSGFGEISRMADVVKPHIGVITNIGMSHIEKLGSVENIAKAKMEILEPLKEDDLVVLNGDSPELLSMKTEIKPKKIYFGLKNGDIRAKNVKSLGEKGMEFEIDGLFENMKFRINIPGIHNVYNALTSIIIGHYFDIPPQDICKKLSDLKTYKMRLEFKKAYFGATIIDDCYNASPDSMKAGLDILKENGVNITKAAILGDMLELGKYSKEAHKNVGLYAADKTDILITIGNYAKDMACGAKEGGLAAENIFCFDDTMSAIDHILDIVKKCNIILLKASRGMQFEKISAILTRGSN
jgi:UDP-N-acetylmuramoyl-tripeptide--D-alanyl-D-alanine ligase